MVLFIVSYCENVDIKIIDDLTDEEIKARVNDALPLGIRIIDVYDDFMDCHDIVYSDYVYKFEFKDNEVALEKIKAVLESDAIMAQKKAKQGKRRVLKETDIKQFIVKYNISIRDDNIILNI